MRSEVLKLFDAARQLSLSPGQPLFLTGDAVELVCLVREGEVALLRRSPQGAGVRLQLAGPGDILAEASVWSPRYHCDAEATLPSVIAALPVARFRQHLAEDPDLADAWARHLAGAVQSARFRAGLLALRGVAERLDAWLDAGNSLPPPGRIQSLAADLGVTREALYRELSRRRKQADRF